MCTISAVRHLHAHTHTHTCTRMYCTPQQKATIPLPLIPINPLSQEGMVSSIPNMNKTSCYSFLDKHPPSARKQEGERRQALVFLQQLQWRWAPQTLAGLCKVVLHRAKCLLCQRHRMELLSTNKIY